MKAFVNIATNKTNKYTTTVLQKEIVLLNEQKTATLPLKFGSNYLVSI